MAFILRVGDVVGESVRRIAWIGLVSLLAVATLLACADGSSPAPTNLPTNTPALSKIPTQPPSDTPAATPAPKVTPEPTATLPVPTPEPTPTPVREPTATPQPTPPTAAPTSIPTPTTIQSIEPTQAPTPTATPTSTPTPTNMPTPTPAVALVLDPEATVTGYWSDGSANVDVVVSLRNEGDLRMDRAVEISVVCRRDTEPVNGCSEQISVSLPNGYGPASGALTLRVPTGELSLAFAYGEHGAHGATVQEINVPERIVGVDRDVWECFSDTADFAGLTPEERVGCAGWYSARVPVQKWDQASSVKVWASGPEGFIGTFKDVLDELGQVLGLVFEWVSTEVEAELVADIGYTLEGGAYYCHPNETACATISGANEMGELERGKISIKDTWGGVNFHELPEPTQELPGIRDDSRINPLFVINESSDRTGQHNEQQLAPASGVEPDGSASAEVARPSIGEAGHGDARN